MEVHIVLLLILHSFTIKMVMGLLQTKVIVTIMMPMNIQDKEITNHLLSMLP